MVKLIHWLFTPTPQTNTFQSVLATDGEHSYAIYLYADDAIQWSDSDGAHAQVGITCGDMATTHPASATASIINVDDNSNVGENGLYVYSLHSNTEPLRKCVIFKC